MPPWRAWPSRGTLQHICYLLEAGAEVHEVPQGGRAESSRRLVSPGGEAPLQNSSLTDPAISRLFRNFIRRKADVRNLRRD